jgi:hypothetical protein|tara:strand:- start:1158 stop:1367 length:210 start_codon:yes stop_codon:yes gene_type:complete
MKVEERIFEAISRIERHEAMCEERSKTIFNRLDSIDESLTALNRMVLTAAGTVILSMGGVIVSLLFLLK